MGTTFGRIQRGLRFVICALAGAAALGGWILVGGGASAASPPKIERGAVLPDLAEQVPSHLEVLRMTEANRSFYVLAFQTIAENLATNYDGELYVVGHRATTSTQTMTADQYINVDDPKTGNTTSQQVIHGVGTLVYERLLAGHDHWHLVGFETYTLERASDYKVISRDHKIGFCLSDDVAVPDPGLRHPHPARDASAQQAALISYKQDTPGCGKHKPNLRRVIESLNAGVGDIYERTLGGQNVDITSVPNGRYVLVLRVNPGDQVVESNYGNDYASVLLSIQRAGPSAVPTFKVLRRCAFSARCPAS